jgi:predicted PurR-regulated permease PerM
MKREQIVTYFFFALLAFVLYHVFLILSPFLTAIFWAAIIAYACYPIHVWIRGKLRASENVGALVTTALILLVVLPTLFLVLVTLASQAVELYERARDWVAAGNLEPIQEELREYSLYRQFEDGMKSAGTMEESSEWDLGKAVGILRSIAGFIAVQVGSFTGNLFTFLINLLLMVAVLFFLIRDGAKIYHSLHDITPMEPENKRLVFDRIRDTFSAVIRGQFITSLVQGLIGWIIYQSLGIPLAVFFGFLTALCSMIPVGGAAIVWVPMTVVLIAYGAYLKAVILFVLGAAGISMVDNVLKPILIGGKTQIPMILLFLGILGGLQVYGLTGIFLAPLMLSLLFVLIKLYREKYPEPGA